MPSSTSLRMSALRRRFGPPQGRRDLCRRWRWLWPDRRAWGRATRSVGRSASPPPLPGACHPSCGRKAHAGPAVVLRGSDSRAGPDTLGRMTRWRMDPRLERHDSPPAGPAPLSRYRRARHRGLSARDLAPPREASRGNLAPGLAPRTGLARRSRPRPRHRRCLAPAHPSRMIRLLPRLSNPQTIRPMRDSLRAQRPHRAP